MADMTENDGTEYGQTRAEILSGDGIIVESDVPPPEYKPAPGRKDADIAQIGHTYAAVLTAHFPDGASADHAIEQLQSLDLTGHDPIQRFEKTPPEITGDVNDPGLAPGEVGIVVQLADESQGEEAVRICEDAGAKHARFYPAQRIGSNDADAGIA
jgi:hypothetical protein